MARKQKGPTIPELQDSIRKELKHWSHLHKSGGTDPSWPDGTNLNLTRAHIHHDRDRLRALCKEQKVRPCPVESKTRLPRIVSEDYCAPRSKAGPCRERRAAARKRKRSG